MECPGINFRPSGDDDGDAGIALFIDSENPSPAKWFTEALEAEGIRTWPLSNCTNLFRTEVVQGRHQVHPAYSPQPHLFFA